MERSEGGKQGQISRESPRGQECQNIPYIMSYIHTLSRRKSHRLQSSYLRVNRLNEMSHAIALDNSMHNSMHNTMQHSRSISTTNYHTNNSTNYYTHNQHNQHKQHKHNFHTSAAMNEKSTGPNVESDFVKLAKEVEVRTIEEERA